MFPKHFRLALTIISGLLIGLGVAFYYYTKTEGITTPTDEVHVHSDFLAYMLDERLHLSEDKYQSASNQVLDPDFHLHDNNDNIIHRHAENLTFSRFMGSLGFTLTNECLTTDEKTIYCSDEENKLLLYVNDQLRPTIADYVNQDGDRILLYYGHPNSPNLTTYLNEVTDQACIYSGTCPERGIPPPESCGLTCEI